VERLDPSVKSRIRKTLEKLGDTPYPGKPLAGPLAVYWSYRAAINRIIYQIIEEKLVIPVCAVGRRKDAYTLMRGLIRKLSRKD